MKEKPNEKIARFQFGFRTCNHRSISQFSGKLVPDTPKEWGPKDLRLLSFSAADNKKLTDIGEAIKMILRKRMGGGRERDEYDSRLEASSCLWAQV